MTTMSEDKEGSGMGVEESRIIKAYRRLGNKKTFARKLKLRIRKMKCVLCDEVIGNKQWEIVGDSVVCINCTHDIGGQG